ncbi:MAG: glycosyltransferase family 2 protein [Stagnimonas sp.]|nr:glycosyltransferase family 2 protein [Stagnimonas sp.]
MATATPLISVIVPSYNQGKYIGATLESIFSQRYRPIEVLVMDGGSTDSTVDVLKQFASSHPELVWLSERDGGPADAVNKGLARARGEFCAIQSSDDLYLPDAIERGVRALMAHPEVLVAYGDSQAIDAQGQVTWHSRWAPYSLENFLLRKTSIPQGSAFFRLDAARAVGGWDKRLYVCDTDFWLRLAFRGPLLKIDGELSALRVHPEQRDKNNRRIFEDYWRMLYRCKPLRRAPLRMQRAAIAGAASLIQRHDAYQSPWISAGLLWLTRLVHPQGRSLVRRRPAAPGAKHRD